MRQPLMLLCAAALAALLAAPPSAALFIHEFDKGDEVLVKVSELTSIKTQIPYSYYSLPFCRPDNLVDKAPTLWQFLHGDRQQMSPYLFEMGVPKKCQIVCKLLVGEKEAKELIEKIEDQYRVNMALDNLPLTIPIRRMVTNGFFYQHGYYIGVIGQYAGEERKRYFIHNHLSFLVKFERAHQSAASRVVAFETKPFSVKHQFEAQWNGVNTRLSTCGANANRFVLTSECPQEIKVGEEIIFTYDVNFEESEIKWASRWDAYLSTTDDQERWFAIVSSLATLIAFSIAMAMTMLRSLHRDIFRHNQLETQSEAQMETGWKLVHGDVFRPPSNPGLLCACAGTGVQLLGTLLIAVALSALGFFSPLNSAGMRNAILLTWILMGLLAGYTSARLYKMFKNGSEWKNVTMATAILFPALAFVIFSVSNTLLQNENSSSTVPSTTMCALILLWSGVAPPLVFVGGYLGSRRPAIEPPVEISKTPRKIPKQPWCTRPAFTIPVGGIFPFAAVFIEFFFGLVFVWFHQFYRGFGFLLITLLLLVVCCAEISIALCYYQLRSGDYRWWWRSFLNPGCSSAVYLFLYAVFFFFTKMAIAKPVPAVLYLGYMLLVSCAFFLLAGTLGFFSCFFFMRFIYSRRAFG
ncbi:transmembrane 9 superfamily member 10-like [Oryza brachyantha]|uniref:Transmembrane 9 superfamily member n=1 Tax=Oryza brachyantha TaxID=4533 RepID=J3MV73_ORYBR|nr:transmembrane 9 superfamily member 10-like [Oryza brachyantha]